MATQSRHSGALPISFAEKSEGKLVKCLVPTRNKEKVKHMYAVHHVQIPADFSMDPWLFWRDVLGSPKFFLAPMVDHSELPWRMLSREYGCQVTYTPMFHASNFATQKKYRKRHLSVCPDDRPLIVQFCANKADTLVAAAKHVVDHCDGIDINLGCPQEIAKRGRYGAFLQDEWTLIENMVRELRRNLPDRVAISCKIRRFDDLNRTVEYAKMLEKAGCSFIGIHARTREQRGCKTGVANWSYVRAVKENVNIPVVANGNIQSLNDALDCMAFTQADAVMTAEGNLYNPAIFLNVHQPVWIPARKYLKYVAKYPISVGMAKAHLFKIFHRCVALEENAEIRVQLGHSSSLEQLHTVVDSLEKKYSVKDCDQVLAITTQPVPPYLCQPRYRYNVLGGQKDAEGNSKIDSASSRNDDLILELVQKRIKLDN